MILDTNLVDTFYRIIKENGIKQNKVANKIGIAKSHLGDILKKKKRMTPEIEAKLSVVLSIYLTAEQASAD